MENTFATKYHTLWYKQIDISLELELQILQDLLFFFIKIYETLIFHEWIESRGPIAFSRITHSRVIFLGDQQGARVAIVESDFPI